MTVGIVGGKLQGLEAAYLVKKQGWKSVLIDRNLHVPATFLADTFRYGDVSKDTSLTEVLRGVDVIIPALENVHALEILEKHAAKHNIPFVHDTHAYGVTSSKTKSNDFMEKRGVSIPRSWPQCGFPVVVKPDGLSGSSGVYRCTDSEELRRMLYESDGAENHVVQEFIEGPTISLEILGDGNRYVPLQVTDLAVDKGFDCKRVTAPSVLDDDIQRRFYEIGRAIARAINLRGIMDVEAIYDGETLNVLEIDARLPSQTPVSVYHSLGINMVELLVRMFIGDSTWYTELEKVTNVSIRHMVYEHIQVRGEVLFITGEHVIADADSLRFEHGLWGADEVMTNYAPERNEWVATLIIADVSGETVRNRRQKVFETIRKECRIDKIIDEGS